MTIDNNYYASLMTKASQRITRLETELNSYKAAQTAPLAVVGMGCRFPGAENVGAFWQLLRNGVDAITEVPATRWDTNAYYDPDADAPGKTYSRVGGFVEPIDTFDAAFFGVSPREALMLDPQQRLLLEVMWETLEQAAIPPTALPKNTGVFIGISTNEYLHHLLQQGLESIDAYLDLGTSLSTASGRQSYWLDLHGPCVSVDTACSSSLTTIHLACQSLRRGECDAAFVGGVGLMLSPALTINFSKARMLSPAGRCKVFDEAADGYVRGEGAGMVLLKRLADAITDGDQILAVVRGSAINQDGHTSGLTVPNGPAQQAVIRQALADGGVAPHAVGYIEAHGTGTALGDPIEMGALGEVFGERSEPLVVGSVKTNIGHLEAAAGIAGFIKAVLTVQHGEIPPNLHFHTPSSRIDWAQFPVKIPTSPTPWPAPQRIAGISSFGFSGTNVHVVVEAWQAADTTPLPTAAPPRPCHLLTLSAKSPSALRAVAQQYAALDPKVELADLCYTANGGRMPFPHRLAVTANSAEELRQTLHAWLAAENGANQPARLTVGVAPEDAPRIAFLFTGQGAQYVEMGRTLYASEPTFRAILDQCDDLYRQYTGASLLAVLYPEQKTEDSAQEPGQDEQSKIQNPKSKIDDTTYTQPALFVLEVALAAVWRSWGIRPQVLIGHSVGELAAACVAGVFSLADGLKLIAARGRLMGALPQGGAMVSLTATEAQVQAALEPYRHTVAIAAVNGPHSVVIAGERTAVMTLAEQLAATGVKTRALTVSHAFHSPLMAPMLAEFRRVAESITYHPPQLPLIANVTGHLAGPEITTPDYWVRHVREPVRFADGVTTLLAQNIDLCLEIGPKPVLLGLVESNDELRMTNYELRAQEAPANDEELVTDGILVTRGGPLGAKLVTLPSLREHHPDWQTMLTSLGALYVHGATIDWAGVYQNAQHHKVALPTYPFQRQRYWVDGPLKAQPARLRPLLDRMIQVPRHQETLFETAFSLANLPFLVDHQVFGRIVSPAACHLALLLSAAEVMAGQGQSTQANARQATYRLCEVVFPAPLLVPAETTEDGKATTPCLVQTIVHHNNVEVISFAADDQDAVVHATGQLFWNHGDPSAPSAFSLAELRARLQTAVDLPTLYGSFRDFTFGPSFRWLSKVWVGADEALAQLHLPATVTGLTNYLLHPGLLDACFQVTGAIQVQTARDQTTLPFRLTELTCRQTPAGRAGATWWCYAKRAGEHGFDIWLLDEQGQCIVAIRGFEDRVVLPQAVKAQESWRTWLYHTVWQAQAQPVVAPPTKGRSLPPTRAPWLIFSDTPADGLWQAIDQPVILVTRGHDYSLAERDGVTTATVDPHQRTQLDRLLHAVQACDKIIYLWGLQTPPMLAVPDAVQNTASELLQLTQALSHAQWQTELWVVTQNSQPIAQGPLALVQAPLWGLCRTIRAEAPELHCRLLDVDQAALAQVVTLVQEEGQSATTEPEIAYHNGLRYVPRLMPYPASDQPIDAAMEEHTPFQVRLAAYGSPDDLHVQPLSRRPPAAHEVEIAVKAASLNFRDLLNILGMLQDYYATALGIQEASALPLGFECAGVITAIGKAVTGLQVGDQVMALAEGAFASFVTVPATDVSLIPTGLSFVEAATIPMAFLTAYQGLYHGAQVQAGERVLIHAAAGGVGLAAVQLAQAAGATVFGTASPNKWEFLVAQGVERVYHSRTLTFADEIMADTNGQGVDVVLNSLTGAFIGKSVDVLRPGGRFAEIGKLGIWSPDEMQAQRPDVAYYPFELNLPGSAHFTPVQPLFAALVALFNRGQLKPLPHTIFPIRQIGTAVRYMQQSKHTGKLVLTFAPTPTTAAPTTLRADSSYLITGGVGGLGLQIAQTLAEAGAGHLVLASRRGHIDDPSQAALLDKLRTTGATVTLVQADVAQATAVARLLATCNAIAPLKGIIHAAGVLDDGVLGQQSPARFATVLQPKVHGAWHLHELTQTGALDFFIAFSSMTSVVATGGQSNYAAANAFLDGLMQARQRVGLPSLSIQWGPWSEVGMAAKLSFAQQGVATIAPAQGRQIFHALLGELGRLQAQGWAEVGVFPIQWPRFLAEPQGASAFYAHFQQQNANAAPEAPAASVGLREQLSALPATARAARLLQHLRTVTAKVLGLASPDQVAPTVGLMAMGLDSLMAVELRNHLSRSLAVPLPATLVFDYPNLLMLQRYLMAELFTPPTVEEEKRPAAAAAPPIEALTQDELAALLMAELAAEVQQ